MSKISKYLILLLITMFGLTGCSTKCEPTERIVVQKVYVPVKMKDKNPVECSFGNGGTSTIKLMLDCLGKSANKYKDNNNTK